MIIIVQSQIERILLKHIQSQGEIVSIDRWAHDNGYSPWWVRHCAHSAAKKGILSLDRLTNRPGRPYRVSIRKERHHEE